MARLTQPAPLAPPPRGGPRPACSSRSSFRRAGALKAVHATRTAMTAAASLQSAAARRTLWMLASCFPRLRGAGGGGHGLAESGPEGTGALLQHACRTRAECCMPPKAAQSSTPRPRARRPTLFFSLRRCQFEYILRVTSFALAAIELMTPDQVRPRAAVRGACTGRVCNPAAAAHAQCSPYSL